MNRFSPEKALNFFLTKILLGILVVGGSVVLTEWLGRLLLDKIQISEVFKNLLIAITQAGVSLFSYIMLFSRYEKRKINELNVNTLTKNSLFGFAAGFILQSLFILVIIITGNYRIETLNPVSNLIPAFSTALSAGFVTELIFRGILFRIIEEKFGIITALSFMTLLFVVFHLNVEGATPVSVLATALISGVLLSSVYVLTGSLWFTIFLHFAWDFTEPGIYGAINPGNSIEQSLLTANISGPDLLTGCQFGPQNSVQALIIITLVCLALLWFIRRQASGVGRQD